ncbi:MAG: PAS domain S-box protein, partial [Chloroflexota bacterium]|nr:PAS domain S-box protein [Chloroflexota bacterium]
ALVRDVADQTWDAVERARAEGALRESEARFRAVWEATSDAIALSGPDGTVLDANPAYLALYGYDEPEVVGRSFAVIFPEEQRTWAEEQYRAAFADPDPPPAYEARVRRKDGGERDVEARADFVVEGGRRSALVSAIRDVTARKVAEAALQENEERLRLALDAAGIGVYLWDPAADRTDADGRLLELVGLEPGEEFSLAAALERNIHPDDRARFAAAAGTMLDPAGPGRLSEEVRWRGTDGRERWLAFTGQAFFEGEGGERRAVRAVGAVLDVTSRRSTEERLRASEERFRTLIQRSADAVQLVSRDGTILYSSDSVETVLGYGPDEIAGRNVADYVHPDDFPGITAWLAGVGATPGSVGAMQYRVRHRDGSWAWVETTIANHLETAGIGAIVGNFRNVTDRKLAEAEREAFAAAAAHDLKTPLTSLRGQTQLLLRRARRGQASAPGALESGLGAIDAAAGRMVALIDEMMDAAHLEAGRTLDLSPAPTDLVALVEAAAAEARSGTTRHTVRVEAEGPAVVGEWDGARLGRVLGNLLGNAVKYSHRGGEVVVRVGREEDAAGGWAVIAVSDQGIGIPAADLPHVFERFRRGGNVTGRIAGAGIGLAGVRRIVAQHGGTIGVESTEGRGSTFTIRLPLAADR